LRARQRWLAVRPAADAMAALVLFVCVSMMIGAGPTSANPHIPAAGQVHSSSPAARAAIVTGQDEPAIVEIATTSSPQAPDAIYGRTSATAAWLLLSLAFSLLIAFNMAILRHMRRAYAPKSGRARR
jgi:hypothetical protein